MSALFAFMLEILAVLLVIFSLGFLLPVVLGLWAIVAYWAISSYNNAQANKRNRAMIKAIQSRK